VDVIWHDHEGIDLNVWEMGRDRLPTFPYDQSQAIFLHLNTFELPKQKFPPEGDNRNKKSTRSGIIIPLQADRFAMVYFGFALNCIGHFIKFLKVLEVIPSAKVR
jgi:hypothetical protein